MVTGAIRGIGLAIAHTASGRRRVLAAASGLGVEELAALAAQLYERARGDLPDQDPDGDFADRGLRLAATFGGAGVVHGDLTPECAEVLGRAKKTDAFRISPIVRRGSAFSRFSPPGALRTPRR